MFSYFSRFKERKFKEAKTSTIIQIIEKPTQIGIISAISLFALIYYEYLKINKSLSKLIDIRVLEKDKKRPDYIYIKYHIYRESILKLKRKQEENSKWINIIIHPIDKWIKSFKHSIAWRLLNIAQNGDKTERFKAVRQLVKFNHLKDWDFRHLAQICDARTAISLAHNGCDQRWFIPVHMRKILKNPKIILNELNQAIIDLKPHICVEYFIKKFVIKSTSIKDNIIIPECIKKEDIKIFNSEYVILKEYCNFLLHMTKHENLCRRFIQKGNLKILLELKKIFEDDIDTLTTLAKCISHISVVSDFVEDFFVTGWITILAEWRDSPDIRLQVISAKAIANLDIDDIHYKLCSHNIYQLYPRNRFLREPKCDVIFVHGLLGGVFRTWRQQKIKNVSELGLLESIVPYEKSILHTRSSPHINNNKNESVNISSSCLKKDEATKKFIENLNSTNDIDDDWEIVYPDCPEDGTSNVDIRNCLSTSISNWLREESSDEKTYCWPMEWLPEDYPDIRILAIDYTSNATEWSNDYTKSFPCNKEHCNSDSRSKYLLNMLSKCDVGNKRPIIWVGHSMGGILIKKMLLKANEGNLNEIKRIIYNTNAIIFLGVPHFGSPLAKWKTTFKTLILPSIEVLELEENNKMLLNLHKNFINILNNKYKKINIISFAENKPTILTILKLPLTIVNSTSANINFGDFYVLNTDHLNLSKPMYRQTFLYQHILHVIKEVIEEKYKKK